MGKIKEFLKTQTMQRRSFLKAAGLSSAGLSLGLPFSPKKGNAAVMSADGPITYHKNIWKTDANGNTYFTPKNLRTDKVNSEGKIVAKVDGWWRSYQSREFDSDFQEFWIAEKNWYYDRLIAFFEGKSDTMEIPNGGHHHPMLATYGTSWSGRGDSDFHLNCAPKGFTILPKEDKIEYINQQIEAAYASGDVPVGVFKKRKELYNQRDLWAKDRFATLELYSGHPINSTDDYGPYPFKETHTFSNVIDNPMSTLTYMSLYNTDGTQSWLGGEADETPTFEFRGFCWMISFYNPANSPYENAISDYINQAHCKYHGGACDIATNIFLIVEEFNNTPGYGTHGRGRRSVPSFPYQEPTKTYISGINTKKMTSSEKMELLKKLRIPV
jgi:hypothetical protein